jgi:DNA-binding IclR family transcriptional regulator
MSSLENALNILTLLDRQNSTLRVGEVSRALRLPKSTVSRLLKTMAASGLLARESDGFGFVPGPKSRLLGELSLTQSGLLDLVERAAERLIQEFGFVCYIGMIADGEFLVIRRKHSIHPLMLLRDVGVRLPIPEAAGGIALLARLPDQEVAAVITRHQMRKVRGTLAGIRMEGTYSRVNTANQVGTVAAAVADPSRDEFLSISFSYPMAATDAKLRQKILERVRTEVAQVGTELGDPCWSNLSQLGLRQSKPRAAKRPRSR